IGEEASILRMGGDIDQSPLAKAKDQRGSPCTSIAGVREPRVGPGDLKNAIAVYIVDFEGIAFESTRHRPVRLAFQRQQIEMCATMGATGIGGDEQDGVIRLHHEYTHAACVIAAA